MRDPASNRGTRTVLIRTLRAAERAYVKERPCATTRILRPYLLLAQTLRRRQGSAVAEDLHNRGWFLRHLLLTTRPEGVTCRGHEGVGREPEVAIRVSDNHQLAGSVQFGTPLLQTIQADSESWTRMLMPGVESRYDEPGQPAVPVYRRLLALPKGAEVNVEVTRRPRVAHVLSMNLIPFQNPLRIQAAHVDSYWKGDEPPPPAYFAGPPFVKDDDTYSQDARFPEDLVRVVPLGPMRDLELAMLEVAVGQYSPVRDLLTVHSSVDGESRSWAVRDSCLQEP